MPVSLPTDRIVSLNGSPVDDDTGDFLETTTVLGRAVRLLLAERGNWPGGGGRVIGCSAWARGRQALDNAQTQRDMISDFEVALEPLTSTGAITDLEVSTERTRKGRLYRIRWTSAIGEPGDIVLTDPTVING